MSRYAGRHRATRPTGLANLRRPAVAVTAAISSVTVGAAAYTSIADVAEGASTGALRLPAGQTTGALASANGGVAADASAKGDALAKVIAARKAADSRRASDARSFGTTAAGDRAKAAKAAAAARKAALATSAAANPAPAESASSSASTSSSTTASTGTSRSSSRPAATTATTTPTYSGSPQSIAMAMLSSYGWSSSQFGCLNNLWNKESGWSVGATNASSGAYGIPQSLPGSKMASAGADWRTNPATQIRWGLGYIKSVYGSPCGAWAHSVATNWY